MGVWCAFELLYILLLPVILYRSKLLLWKGIFWKILLVGNNMSVYICIMGLTVY